MSLEQFFSMKCVDATIENITLGLQKLSEPMDMFSFNVSGALVETLKGSLGDIASAGVDFLKNNADTVAYSMVQAFGLEDKVNAALDSVFKILTFAQLAANMFVFHMLKNIAKNCVTQLRYKRGLMLNDSKEDPNLEDGIKVRLTQLYNQLKILCSGDTQYDAYLDNLKTALVDIVSVRDDLRVIKETLELRKIFLGVKYENAEYKMLAAQSRLRPSTSGNPYTTPFYNAANPVKNKKATLRNLAGSAGMSGRALLTTTVGYPSHEQMDALLAIPRCCQQLVKSMISYGTEVALINGYLKTYIAGADAIITAMDDKLKKFAAEHLALMIGELTSLAKEMRDTILPNPVTKKDPNPVTVTSMAFKWTAQSSMVISQMKLLPAKSLTSMNYAQKDVDFFNHTVEQLERLDTVSSGKAVLIATDAQEEVGGFEQQMLVAMLGAINAIPKAKAKKEIFSLIETLIARVDLTVIRDKNIERILQSFIDYKMEGEEEFSKIIGQIEDIMKKAGLDKALALWQTGDLVAFFGLTGGMATFAGAALATLALLKNCFDTNEQKEEMTKVQRALEREMDLLNLKISFDFDLAIFKNIDLCLNMLNLSKLFNLKEFLCGLVPVQSIKSTFAAIGTYVGNEIDEYKSAWKDSANNSGSSFYDKSESQSGKDSEANKKHYQTEWQKLTSYWQQGIEDTLKQFSDNDIETAAKTPEAYAKVGYPFPSGVI